MILGDSYLLRGNFTYQYFNKRKLHRRLKRLWLHKKPTTILCPIHEPPERLWTTFTHKIRNFLTQNNPHGLADSKNYSTALDQAKLSRKVFIYPISQEVVHYQNFDLCIKVLFKSESQWNFTIIQLEKHEQIIEIWV